MAGSIIKINRQAKMPVHTQPNLCRVVRRICQSGQRSNTNRALLTILEMGINEVEKRN